MGSLVQFACDFLELWSLNYQKLFSFCSFMLIAARNLDLFDSNLYIGSESSHYALSINDIADYAMNQYLEDISVWN